MGLRPQEFYKWPKLMEDGSIRPATPLDAWNGEVEEILPRVSYFGPAKKFREILFIKKDILISHFRLPGGDLRGKNLLCERLILAVSLMYKYYKINPHTYAKHIPDDYKVILL